MKIAILGYNMLTKAITQMSLEMCDIEICGVFADNINVINEFGTVKPEKELSKYISQTDVLIICENVNADNLYKYEKYCECFTTVMGVNACEQKFILYDSINNSAKCGRHTTILLSDIKKSLDLIFSSVLGIFNINLSFNFCDKQKVNTNLINDITISAKIMLAYSKAAFKQYVLGNYGAFTIFDLRLKDLTRKSKEDLLSQFL